MDPILSGYDDKILVSPMEQINSISEYLNAIKVGRIYDVQPVRDLSYWVDIQAKQFVPFASFHLTNAIIWLATIFLIYLILLRLGVSKWSIYGTTALYAFHPVFINSVAWIAARKHLLSTFFIIAATFLVVDACQSHRAKELKRSTLVGILVFYFLACFSQPINVLWPVFALVYLAGHGFRLLRSATGKMLLFFCAGIGFFCLYLNLKYYTGIFVAQNGGIGKYVSPEHNDLGVRLLALGRYFFQVICPVWPCISSPYPGSIKNMIGLALLPIFVFILKKYGNRECWFWLLYFTLPLVPVLAKMTNIFMSGTYLMNAGLGVFFALVFVIEKNKSFFAERIRVVIVAFVCSLVLSFFFYKSVEQSRAWESNLQLWENAYLTEATPTNATKYGLFLLDAGQIEPALNIALQVKEWDPDQHDLPLLLAKSTFDYPGWGTEKKIALLEHNRMNSPWFFYYLAGLYASHSRYDQAFSEMRSAMNDPDKMVYYFAKQLEVIAAEIFYFCTRSGVTKSCGALVATIKEQSQQRPYVRFGAWDDSKYIARLTQLGVKWEP